ncbi:hypothetical protein MNBD_GAMMA09-2464 [hydrothermal vent metagenome]|uniref:Uncharacterized protein n=1 Tax=hydrothermal vent metagenome TaxID=652676 RepID=A0A3B0Y5E2_9ZZZZ
MSIFVPQMLKISFCCLVISILATNVYADSGVPESSMRPVVEPDLSGLKLATARYDVVAHERVLDARVEAVHKATVSAQTSGRISKIFYDVNDYVKKGAVLLRMRDKDQQAKVNDAQANFNQAQAEFSRVKKLNLNKLIAKSAVDRAELQLKSSRARLDQAQENLQRTIVRAPYSGIVVKRHIEVGETARLGVPLFTGLSLETLRVVVDLPQDIINVVRELKQARVLLLKDNDRSIESTSMTISPYADETSHTFQVRVNLPPGDHGLYPGMAVKVAFATGKTRMLLIPSSAVAHRSEVTAVYVMTEQQSLHMRQVRAGHEHGNNMIEVLAGLQENEQVAIDPVMATTYIKEHKVRQSGAR